MLSQGEARGCGCQRDQALVRNCDARALSHPLGCHRLEEREQVPRRLLRQHTVWALVVRYWSLPLPPREIGAEEGDAPVQLRDLGVFKGARISQTLFRGRLPWPACVALGKRLPEQARLVSAISPNRRRGTRRVGGGGEGEGQGREKEGAKEWGKAGENERALDRATRQLSEPQQSRRWRLREPKAYGSTHCNTARHPP